MTILEHIKKAHANIKNQPKEARWQYFWDYYKWHVVAVVLVIALLIQGIVSFTNRKDIVFSGILLNCKIGVDDSAFLENFYDYAGIDSATQEAAFYTDLMLTDQSTKNDVNAIQRIMAGIATKELDFVVGQTVSFRLCAYNTSGLFIDLRSFLDQATLEKLADRLYYIDGDYLEKLRAPVGEAVDLSLTNAPDPTKPELMKDPIPVGIDISDREAFQSAYYFPDTVLYLGVTANTPRAELVKQFINYLFA
ncbi:MAG: hypothetical protein IJA47_05065 [Oscillospiraceae bacterium]|nr:hypothetical protein [Oscillospiraceae bacterium]